VASDPEALAQLARLLGVDASHLSGPEGLAHAVNLRMDKLVSGMLDELTASDDVTGRDSALEFVNQRLEFLGALLDDGQRSRLLQALRGKIEAW
jgi:hypothetical protein